MRASGSSEAGDERGGGRWAPAADARAWERRPWGRFWALANVLSDNVEDNLDSEVPGSRVLLNPPMPCQHLR